MQTLGGGSKVAVVAAQWLVSLAISLHDTEPEPKLHHCFGLLKHLTGERELSAMVKEQEAEDMNQWEILTMKERSIRTLATLFSVPLLMVLAGHWFQLLAAEVASPSPN